MFARLYVTLLALLTMTLTSSAQTSVVSREGVLRAAYLATNPAHAVRDPATGEARGVAVDVARELSRSVGAAVTLMPLENPQRVIDAVRNGEADIGFVAYNPERAGPVEFSKPYVLVQQTFLVRADSRLRSVADVDRAAVKLGATRNDSIALYLRRTLTQAQLVELDDSSRDAVHRMLREGTLDAVGANRQRLTDMQQGAADLRLLPDDLYGVEQTIIVPSGKRDALDRVNRFIDDVRASGFLQTSIDRSGVVGIAVAPAR
jgi:polar amino acid transport system substrate-binding protein